MTPSVPYEFRPRGAFRCTDMVGHGSHNKLAGTWSDDTSMALAICDSYRELRLVDVDDIRGHFVRWHREGAYAVDGLFDIGNATHEALKRGHGLTGERDDGNGSLMRSVPLAFTDAADDGGAPSPRLRTRTQRLRKRASPWFISRGTSLPARSRASSTASRESCSSGSTSCRA